MKKDWSLILNKKSTCGNSPYNLAINFIKSGKVITCKEVNKVLENLGVSISQNLLDEILNRPRIQFSNLNKNIIKSPKFLRHIGTTRSPYPPEEEGGGGEQTFFTFRPLGFTL